MNATQIVNQLVMCYGLPYGLLGQTSLIITYYTALCALIEVKAYFPCLPEKKGWSTLGIVLSVASVAGVIIAIMYTHIHCGAQGLITAVAWSKVSTVHWLLTAQLIFGRKLHKEKGKFKGVSIVTNAVLIISHILELSCIITIHYQYGDIYAIIVLSSIAYLCYIFITPLLFILSIGTPEYKRVTFVLVLFALLGIPPAILDWQLSIIIGNFIGYPDGILQLPFWMYFVSKRLLMFN